MLKVPIGQDTKGMHVKLVCSRYVFSGQVHVPSVFNYNEVLHYLHLPVSG
jgi:hypothetical protein